QVLRHAPEKIGANLTRAGWLDINELITKFNKKNGPKYKIDREFIDTMVAEDDKQRYSFNAEETMIRANQGHSISWIEVDTIVKKRPPAKLYHGTNEVGYHAIRKSSLKPMKRNFVHLSSDIDTAKTVANRRGLKNEYTIFEINTKKAMELGTEFRISENGVWLCKEVHVDALKAIYRKGKPYSRISNLYDPKIKKITEVV
ncbi:MAG: RNA 2'-phosphotransferase, partial [Cetobacterium sp.]|uniref:RNA 2'-phosphotransferase n=1 Tax=Cetobacterium sp. TaxID=2071632 RepID=UPI003F35F930